jgi:hypothetical protein
MDYTCDNWVVLFFDGDVPHYKLLVGTSGGYTQGDSWRMNSGIVSVTDAGDYYLFYGYSGSVYRCGKKAYALRMNNYGIYEQLKTKFGDKISLLPETTKWTKMDWLL